MSLWMWKFGDFEMYHSLLLHERRQNYGGFHPVIWKEYGVEPMVRFAKTVTSEGGPCRLSLCGKGWIRIFLEKGEERYYPGEEFIFPKGTFRVWIQVSNPFGLPCAYLEGAAQSDDSWQCDDTSGDFRPVGTWEVLNDPERTPEEFPFCYEAVEPVLCEPAVMKSEYGEALPPGSGEALPSGFWEADEGILFDFGKELFGRLTVSGGERDKIHLYLGESREEALDKKWSNVRFTVPAGKEAVTLPCNAFRYIFADDKTVKLSAEYEYLPLARRGSFHSGEEVVDWVWETAAYTFHLNSREFFLDGIKRDRWVWSGDAFQSQFVNHYLFFDLEIEKRTLIALGGKAPFCQHINTIVDYTFYWFMGLYEYYVTYGDRKFLEQMLPQIREVMGFCKRRLDPDGMIRNHYGDWIFIDWDDFDKTGALLGEQVLLAKALEAYGKILGVLGEPGGDAIEEARRLEAAILEKFYDPQLGAFVDSYESGLRKVTRQCNALAYLYLPCTKEQKESIYRRVMTNDEVPAITTPYFKFYENRVLCEAGDTNGLERCIREYYGEMKKLGATTLFEMFDPTETGTQHYAMYGSPYRKSLCHAWAASPIYLLGRYRMGVKNTGIAYDTFEVRPELGTLEQFEGTVPLPQGEVRVRIDKKEVAVMATAPGGTLIVDGVSYLLTPGEERTVALSGRSGSSSI